MNKKKQLPTLISWPSEKSTPRKHKLFFSFSFILSTLTREEKEKEKKEEH